MSDLQPGEMHLRLTAPSGPLICLLAIPLANAAAGVPLYTH